MVIKKTAKTLNHMVQNISPHIYFILVGISYTIYFVSIIGLAYINPTYVKSLNKIIQTFVAIVLFIRFNPFQTNITCTRNDRIFILASSFFLLINDEFVEYIRTYFLNHVKKIKNLF